MAIIHKNDGKCAKNLKINSHVGSNIIFVNKGCHNRPYNNKR